MAIEAVATILKRDFATDNCSLYSPVRTVLGYYNEKQDVFCDATGDVYHDILSSILKPDDNYMVFSNLISLEDLENKIYVPGLSFDDIVNEYCSECQNYIVISVSDFNGTTTLLRLDTKVLADALMNKEQDISNEEMIALAMLKQKYKFSDDFDSTMQRLLDMAISGNMSLDDLKKSRKVVEHLYYELGENLRVLDVEIDAKNTDVSFENEESLDTDNDDFFDDIDIEKTYETVKKSVVAQDEAIYRLVIETARAYDSGREKDGILITGSSGVGKTLAIKALSECLNRPFLIIDSTQLTMPGYVGKNIEECLYELYVKCGGNKTLAENAIVYFDEIDKKGSDKKSDVAGQGVLNLLLKFLDGTTYVAADSKYKPNDTVEISTNNMLVIAGGAFSDVYKKTNSRGIGFGSNLDDTYEPDYDDFVNKGMMTKEFMGRFPIVIHFKDLDKDSLRDVLTDSDKSPLLREKNTFMNAGVKLSVTPEYLEAIALGAFKLNTGARGLKKLVTDTTWRPYSTIKANEGVYSELVLDEDTVSDNKVYKLIRNENINTGNL